MDEIDAIGRRRTSSEGEVKTDGESRVLFELLSQLDGFDELDKVKVIMATNRPDVLDPALLRPGRIDKKIEIPLPNGDSRMKILEIHASRITKQGEIDYEKVVKLSEVRCHVTHTSLVLFLFKQQKRAKFFIKNCNFAGIQWSRYA